MTSLPLVAILPPVAKYVPLAERACVPQTIEYAINREIVLHEQDMLVYQAKYAEAVEARNRVAQRMRAFHIQRTKNALLGLRQLHAYLQTLK